MTSTSESLLSVRAISGRLYMYAFSCTRVCYTRTKTRALRRAPHVARQIGEDKRRTRTGDKRNIIRWTRLGENYFAIENVVHRHGRAMSIQDRAMHLSNKTVCIQCLQ